MNSKGIGDNVRFYRKRANMTQKQLADILNYKSQASIARIENGERDVLLSTAQDLADALNIPVECLFETVTPEKPYSLKRVQTTKEGECMEFLPYLMKAEDWKLEAVRKILDMPPKKICKSEEEIV